MKKNTVKLDAKEPIIKKFIDTVHNGINRRLKNLSSHSEVDYVFESRVFKLLCEDRHLSAKHCVEKLNDKYNYNTDEEAVIRVFRSNSITTMDSRDELVNWAISAVDAFVQALISRNEQDSEKYFKLQGSYDYWRIKSKVFCLMFYQMHPEINIGDDLINFEKFGRIYAQYIRYDMNDFLRDICGVQNRGKNKNPKRTESERLKDELARNEMLVKDLQEDFDARLEENHQNEIADFFARLNSERYGCILDAVINVRGGIQKLRKQNVELPPEISGLFILIDNLVKFVRDNEINPIMKLGSVHSMKAGDIENYSGDYEGSPYADAEEIKKLKVLSPGWYYKSKDIQISRPRLKEYADK